MTFRSTFAAAAAGAALIAAAFAAPAQASTNLLVNGGFEDTALSAGQYVYPTQGSTVGGWYYYGPAIADGTGPSAWWPGGPGLTGFEGDNFAALQATSVLAQVFTFGGGGIDLSWLDAGRPNTGCCNGDQSYKVALYNYGTGLLTTLGQYATYSGQPFGEKTASVSGLAGGSYALIFQGLSTSDNTAFIDRVSAVGSVPEPATWAMMIAGFGVAGAVLRRRRTLAAAG